MVQTVVGDDEVEGLVGKGQILHVTVGDLMSPRIRQLPASLQIGQRHIREPRLLQGSMIAFPGAHTKQARRRIHHAFADQLPQGVQIKGIEVKRHECPRKPERPNPFKNSTTPTLYLPPIGAGCRLVPKIAEDMIPSL